MTFMGRISGRAGIRRIAAVAVMVLCASAFTPGVSLAGRDQAASEIHSAVSAGAALRLNKARTAVILFTGADTLRTKVMEDALAVELMRAGIRVVPRSKVELLIAQKLAETEQQAPSSALPGEAQTSAPSASRVRPLGVMEVAKAAGADVALIGTMVDAISVTVPQSGRDPGYLTNQAVMLLAASIQVIDLDDTDVVAMVITGSWPKGIAFDDSAVALAKPFQDVMKR
ncbi:MAG TPA: hypothetical protein VNA25_13095 [Phycisphaerae bacterium]|nr:hypothetical protein [Phycisphaerae bacterium]